MDLKHIINVFLAHCQYRITKGIALIGLTLFKSLIDSDSWTIPKYNKLKKKLTLLHKY